MESVSTRTGWVIRPSEQQNIVNRGSKELWDDHKSPSFPSSRFWTRAEEKGGAEIRFKEVGGEHFLNS